MGEESAKVDRFGWVFFTLTFSEIRWTNALQYGLGSMGLKMASNLQAHFARNDLPPLLFSNRTLGKGQALVEVGAEQVPDFLSLVEASDIIFTMVGHELQSGCSTHR